MRTLVSIVAAAAFAVLPLGMPGAPPASVPAPAGPAMASGVSESSLGQATSVGARSTVVPSGVQDFEFESFDAHYELGLDDAGHGVMRVTETIVARFPDFDQNRGIIRAIPLEYRDASLELSMHSITDEHGRSVPFDVSERNGFMEFALGTDEFVHGRVTYVLDYTARHVIAHFGDANVDEFYWDVNGTGWAQPFDRVSALVTLSPALKTALTGATACFAGHQGSSDTCELVAAGGGFNAEVGPLLPSQNLTVVVAFEPGTVVQPPHPRDHWIVRIAPFVLLGLAVLVLIGAIVIRLRLWRDADVDRALIAQYERPDDTWLMLDANIAGRPDTAVPAQLMDFAVRGNLRIIDRNTRDRGRFRLEFVTDEGLSTDELRLIDALFGKRKPGMHVEPGQLSATRGAAVHRIVTGIQAKAVSKKLRHLPGNTALPKTLRVIAFLLAGAFVPVWMWASEHEVLNAGILLAAAVTVALWIATLVALRRPTPLTARGAELRHHLRGIREYLTIAEEDRIRMLQGPNTALRDADTGDGSVVRLYESLLPWAIVWGVERQWLEHLRTLSPEATPEWFEGARFDAGVLTSFQTASVSRIRPIVSTSSGGGSWSSSGSSSFSSGSSGGGFSGGGGGGGGGGGR